MESQVLLVNLDKMDSLDKLELRVRKGQLETRVPRGHRESLETLVQLEQRELLET